MSEHTSTGPGGDNLSSVSSQYRTAAGLPPRESDAPTDPLVSSERVIAREPEGGYGGEGGILNSGAISGSEQARADLRAEQLEEREEQVAETGLSGEETATEVARVTGEDVPDVKPGADTVVDGDVEDRDEER